MKRASKFLPFSGRGCLIVFWVKGKKPWRGQIPPLPHHHPTGPNRVNKWYILWGRKYRGEWQTLSLILNLTPNVMTMAAGRIRRQNEINDFMISLRDKWLPLLTPIFWRGGGAHYALLCSHLNNTSLIREYPCSPSLWQVPKVSTENYFVLLFFSNK